MNLDLLAGLDPNAVAAIADAYAAEQDDAKRARALVATHRLQVRRAKSEATLADVILQPATLRRVS